MGGAIGAIGGGAGLGSSALGGKGAAEAQQQGAQQIFGALNSPLGSFDARGLTLNQDLNTRSADLFSRQSQDALDAGTESGLFRSAVRAQDVLERQEQALSGFGGIEQEVGRLRGIAAPRENALRESTLSRLRNRGRLAVGVGGGLTGNFSNPELAALEEGLARADAGRVDQARQEEQRLLGNITDAISLNLGINAQAANLGSNAFNLRTGSVNNALIPLAQLGAGQAFGGLTTSANTSAANTAALGNQFGGIFSGLGQAFGNGGSFSNFFGGGGGGGGGFDTTSLAGSADTFDFDFGGV